MKEKTTLTRWHFYYLQIKNIHVAMSKNINLYDTKIAIFLSIKFFLSPPQITRDIAVGKTSPVHKNADVINAEDNEVEYGIISARRIFVKSTAEDSIAINFQRPGAGSLVSSPCIFIQVFPNNIVNQSAPPITPTIVNRSIAKIFIIMMVKFYHLINQKHNRFGSECWQDQPLS